MKCKPAAVALSLLVGACAANNDGKTETPPTVTPVTSPQTTKASDAAPVAPTRTQAMPSIASVNLSQDCPDPEASPATPYKTAPSAGARSDRARRAGPAPCIQSRLNIVFDGQGPESAKVELRAVRLLSEKGDVLATLAARMPTIWVDDGYVPWDEKLSAASYLSTSYKVSVPDWGAMQSKTGLSSFGTMFVVEADVAIGGTVSTIRSAQFEREMPENIRT